MITDTKLYQKFDTKVDLELSEKIESEVSYELSEEFGRELSQALNLGFINKNFIEKKILKKI